MIVEPASSNNTKCYPTTRDQSIYDPEPRIELSVEVSPERKALLTLHRSDNPLAAAKRFCFENNIDFKLINPISKRIDMLLKDDTHDCPMRHIALEEDLDRHEEMAIPKVKQQKEGLNSGVMIYERNRRLGELKRNKIKERILEIQTQQESELTFQPEINPVSKLLAQRLEDEFGRESFYERNSQMKRSRALLIEKSREKEDMKECTFYPKTNVPKSTKSLSNSFYLSNLARPKKNGDLEKQKSSFSFHPKINPISEMINNGVSFEERQEKYEYERLMRKSNSKQENSLSSLRNSTVRRNQSLTATRNIQQLPIGEHLYNQRHNKEAQIAKIKSVLLAKPHEGNENSSKLYEVNKMNAFVQIFRTLDSNGDDIISASKISMIGLPPDVLELVAPLLSQMEQLNTSLTQEEFVQALEKLFSTFNVSDRNKLIKFNRNAPNDKHPSYSFKPMIDQKSTMLASRVRQFDTGNVPGVSLYNFCEHRRSLLDRKLQEKRKQKENREVEDCTFKPVINK